MPASEAFILVLLGTLTVYGEFVRPGRLIPGLLGSLMVVAGLHDLMQLPLSGAGTVFLGSAAALFLVEAFWRVDFVAGLAGTALLSSGSCLLVRLPPSFSPALAIPASLIFGYVTVYLCWQAKRARRNKWADLSSGNFSPRNP